MIITNVKLCSQLGRAALHCAAAGGHADVIDTLLSAEAALELTDKVSYHLVSPQYASYSCLYHECATYI